jgi:hypothetical protein
VATTSLYLPCKASSVSSTPSNKTIGFQVALCRIVIFSLSMGSVLFEMRIAASIMEGYSLLYHIRTILDYRFPF